MKKYLITILLSALLAACGSSIYHNPGSSVDEIDLPPPVEPEPGDWKDLASCVDIEVAGSGKSDCVLTAKKNQRYSLVDVSFVTCPACIQNFPIFAKLADEIQATTTVSVVLFKDSRDASLKYISQHPEWFKHRVGLDVANKQTQALKLQAAPTMYLFDMKAADPNTPIGKFVGVLTQKRIDQIKAAVKNP